MAACNQSSPSAFQDMKNAGFSFPESRLNFDFLFTINIRNFNFHKKRYDFATHTA